MKTNSPRYVKQYAKEIIDFSSQYGGENPRSFSYSISNIIGEPRIFPKYGDFTQAAVMRTYGSWWNRCAGYKKDARPSSASFHSEDYIDLIFEIPVYPWSIAIYETYNPGAVIRILALCQEFPKQNAPSDGDVNEGINNGISGKVIPLPLVEKYTHWEVLWSNPHPEILPPKEARMFAPILHEINHLSRIIRLEFCHKYLDYYTELDAVELTGTLTYTSSSSVDPPIASMKALSISNYVAPSSSSEDLAYIESKVDLKSQDVEQVVDCTGTPTITDTSSAAFPSGYIGFLPPEIVAKIFKYLSFPDFCRVARVCKLFKAHSYDPSYLKVIDLHPHWQIINDNALQSIQQRCHYSGTSGAILESLTMRWLGGGDIVTSRQLEDFVKTCDLRNLISLDLGSSPTLTDNLLALLVQFAPNLIHLDIPSCDKTTSIGMRVLHKFDQLQSLNLYRTKIDDAGIICIIQYNPHLVELNLGSCPQIQDYDRVLLEISNHCYKLRILDTWRAKSLTSRGVIALVSKCKYLEELDFGWCGGLQSSSGCFETLAAKCPHLTKLFLTTNRTISDNEVNLLSKFCTRLRQLDILGTRLVTIRSIENLLRRCKNLEFLDVSFCYSFTSQVVESLKIAYPHVEFKRSFQS